MTPLLFLLAAATAGVSASVAAVAFDAVATGGVAASKAVAVSGAADAAAGGTVGATRSIAAAPAFEAVAAFTVDAVKDSPQAVALEAVAAFTVDAVKGSPQALEFDVVGDGSIETAKDALYALAFDAIADGGIDQVKAVTIGVSFDAVAEVILGVTGRIDVTFEAVAGGSVGAAKGAIAGPAFDGVSEGDTDAAKGAIAALVFDAVAEGAADAARGADVYAEFGGVSTGTVSGTKATIVAATGEGVLEGSTDAAKGAIAGPTFDAVADGTVISSTAKALLRVTVDGDQRVTVDGDRRSTNLLAPITSVRFRVDGGGSVSTVKDVSAAPVFAAVAEGSVDYEAALINDFSFYENVSFAATTETVVTIPISKPSATRRAVVVVIPVYNVGVGPGVMQVETTGFAGAGSGTSETFGNVGNAFRGARIIYGNVSSPGNIVVTIDKSESAPAGSWVIGHVAAAWFFDTDAAPRLDVASGDSPTESVNIGVDTGAKIFAAAIRSPSTTPPTFDFGGFFDDEEFVVEASGSRVTGASSFAFAIASLEYEGTGSATKEVDYSGTGNRYGAAVSWIKTE